MSLGEYHGRVRERFGYVDEHILWCGRVLERLRKKPAKIATGLECDLGSRHCKMGEVSVEGVGNESFSIVLVCPRSGEHCQGMFCL